MATLADLEVPLPSIGEQRRIADILDRADALRAKRREGLVLLDDLQQSIFLDMFGDPVTNPHGLQRTRLGALLIGISSGQSPVCLARCARDDEWAERKLSAVTACRYLSQENKALPSVVSPRLSSEVHEGDLLLSRKNTRVGRCMRASP